MNDAQVLFLDFTNLVLTKEQEKREKNMNQ